MRSQARGRCATLDDDRAPVPGMIRLPARRTPAERTRAHRGKNGLLTVELPEPDVRELMEGRAGERDGAHSERRLVTLPSGREVAFAVDEDVRHRLLNGYDDIGLTMQRIDAIDALRARARASGAVDARLVGSSARTLPGGDAR